MTDYRTVSIPKPLAKDITRLMEDVGYWPSLGSFVREALIEKLQKERERQMIIKGEADG